MSLQDETPTPTSEQTQGTAPAASSPSPTPPAGSEAGSPPAAGSETAPAAPTRPEGLPDQFWDDKAGVKFAELTASLTEAQTLKAERDARLAAVPDDPAKYELKLPDGFELPGGAKWQFDPNDPLVAVARTVAKNNGLDQKGFEGMVAEFAANEARIAAATEAANREAIGPKYDERVTAIGQRIGAQLGAKEASFLAPFIRIPEGLKIMERLLGNQGGGFTSGGRDGGAGNGIDGWADMSPAEKLHAARMRNTAAR